MQYLHKIGETFYLRLPVPKDLQPYFPAPEIKRSLHTKRRNDATQILVKLVYEYQQQFFILRYAPPMEQRPPSRQALDIFGKMYPDISATPSMIYNVYGKLITTWPLQLMSIMDALGAGFLPNKEGVLDLEGITPPPIPAYQHPQKPVEAIKKDAKPQAKPILLTVAANEYIEFVKHGNLAKTPLSSGTVETYERSLRFLSDFVGSKCDVVTASKNLTEFSYDRLSDGLGKSSTNTYLMAIKAFYSWCNTKTEPKYIEVVPTVQYCSFSDAELTQVGNKTYKDSEIQLILDLFTTLESKSINERKRNLSFVFYCLILLFSGFRKQEAMILEREDFKDIDKIPVIDLSITKIARLKNLSAPRLLPVHKKLSGLFLSEFVKGRDTEEVFDFSYSVYAELLNGILYGLKIKTKPYEKLFHSMRHGFDTSLSTIETCQDSHRRMLMGHGKKGMDKVYLDIVHQHVPAFNASVQQMPFNYDFTKLKAFLRSELDYFKK